MNPPVLMPPVPGRPLILYMTILDESMGCMLGQHDESGKKERAVYYLSKKFTTCEMNYSLLERTCCGKDQEVPYESSRAYATSTWKASHLVHDNLRRVNGVYAGAT